MPRLAFFFLILFLAFPILAIDPARCNEDGVTETPPFATRGADGCTYVDPGNGDAPVRFQFESYHKRTVGPACGDSGIIAKVEGGGCPNGQCLSLIHLDNVADNYTNARCKNKDVLFIGNGYAWEQLFFKNTRWYNGWKCQGGAWDGPGSLGCASGEDSGAHADNLQIRGHPVNGGWFVMQDSEIVNSHIQLMIYQTQSESGPNGSVSFQGVRFETSDEPVGAAQHWISDCIDRGEEVSSCTGNRANVGYNAKEFWLIDVWGNSVFSHWGPTDLKKLIVVNTGCSRTGCGEAEIGYNNGWPHPLVKSATPGPRDCPNGKIPPLVSGIKEMFCYTSLEEAAKVHKLPPFANLSTAGWKNASPPQVELKRPVKVRE